MTRFTVGLMFVAAVLSAPACGHSDAATAAADGEAIQAKTSARTRVLKSPFFGLVCSPRSG